MKLMIIILNKVEKLDDLLVGFTDANINGGTILSSTGMARELYGSNKYEDLPLFGSLRSILDPERKESRTILTVIKDDQVKIAEHVIESVVGPLNKPDTVVLFTVPVDYFRGANL